MLNPTQTGISRMIGLPKETINQLLFDIGYNITLILKRLGHEKISATLDTYSHFFPSSENILLGKLDDLKI